MTKLIPYDTAFYERQLPGSCYAASCVAKLLADIAMPSSVVDFGCGHGAWLRAFQEVGAETILGLDGDYVNRDHLLIGSENFVAVDLSDKISLQRRFDIAISVEVAEHISDDAAGVFIDNLVSASDAIIFGAAIPHQGGRNHRNERWQSYWAEKFASHEYRAVDLIRPHLWNDPEVAPWYAQNTILYLNDDGFLRFPILRNLVVGSGAIPAFDVVHPQTYLQYADPDEISIMRSCRNLIRSLSRRLRFDYKGKH
jgi:hypothetical protein